MTTDYAAMADAELIKEIVVVCKEGSELVLPHIQRLLRSEGGDDKMDSLIRLGKSMDLEEELYKLIAMSLNIGYGMGVWHERGVGLNRIEALMPEAGKLLDGDPAAEGAPA